MAAMDRLLAGESPFRSLTFVSLAKEAGVGRATLNRMPDLKQTWEERVRAAGEDATTAHHPALRIRQLERQLRDEREAHRRLQEAHRTMAHQYQHTILLLRARDAAVGPPNAGDGATVLPLDRVHREAPPQAHVMVVTSEKQPSGGRSGRRLR